MSESSPAASSTSCKSSNKSNVKTHRHKGAGSGFAVPLLDMFKVPLGTSLAHAYSVITGGSCLDPRANVESLGTGAFPKCEWTVSLNFDLNLDYSVDDPCFR
ncbi:hypothetical protein VE00_01267 [Pseudogymnoascus sp. WSF 3629]|jgi:hypothetical protein|nr:hypothetical protein VE00_01267 [Pseudogymnoascus sp. WSF 3629]